MEIALPNPGLATQLLPGVGLRLVRRFGGAVRSVLARGMRLARGQHRTSLPQPNVSPTTAQAGAAPPTPDSAGDLHRSRGATPALLRRRLRPARHRDARFTPEAYPTLTPEACAILNTPVEECDPEIVEALLSALAHQIAANLPAEAGLHDADAVFATLWSRLGGALGQSGPQASQEAGSTGATEASADVAASPDPLPPIASSMPDAAPLASPAVPATPQPDVPPVRLPPAAVIAAASTVTSVAATLTTPLLHKSRGMLRRGLSSLRRAQLPAHKLCRTFRSRGISLRNLLPRHVCYASRASPA